MTKSSVVSAVLVALTVAGASARPNIDQGAEWPEGVSLASPKIGASR
jgi:hypothetical protein